MSRTTSQGAFVALTSLERLIDVMQRQTEAVEGLREDLSRTCAALDHLAWCMEKNVLTIDETVHYTGITKRELRQLCKAGLIPHYYRPDRRGEPTFKKDEVEAWMTRTRGMMIDDSKTASRRATMQVIGKEALADGLANVAGMAIEKARVTLPTDLVERLHIAKDAKTWRRTPNA